MKLVFMRTRNVLVLLAVAVLVSLGTATQYADAFTTNGRIVGIGANEVDGTFYHKADNNGVYIKVVFAGDRTASGSSGWADAIKVGDRAPNGALTLTNANPNSRVVGSAHDYSSSSEFSFEYKLENLDDGATTIVFPAGVIGPAGNPTDRNPKLTYTFVYDSTDPIMSNDFTGVLFERGDLIHRGNVLVVAACDDINRTSDITFASGPDPDTSRIGDYVKSFSCTDNAGNTATATKLYRVIEPINISIASNNVYDTAKARYNDEVTVTFDLATGSTFTGSVSDDGNNRNLVFATVGNTGTMTKTLNGDENSNSQITFSLTVTDSDGPSKTYTAVQGTGVDTSVTTDFDYPTTPDNISIAHNGAGGATSVAKFGDIVTVTFDTDTDATRTTGTIGGKDATYALDGTTGKLTITLDGTESSEVQPLPFSFRIFDYVGNGGVTQTAVKGDGDGTSVITDTMPPVAPSFLISNVLFNETPISLSGLAERGSTVELFKGDTSVGTVSAGSGFFEFTGVKLTEGSNYFTITATDASSNTSLFSGTEILILDTILPAIPTNISIESDNARDTSLAKLGDTVTVTFDTEEGSNVTGTIDGKSADFDYDGTSSTLTRTLDGTETEDASLTFEFTQTDVAGNVASTLTAVRGTSGSTTSVTADFVAPAIPTNISIASDNADPARAKLGDIVTVTFDTEAGSTVVGTINGEVAKFAFNGISSTLTRTLDGTEAGGTSLAFEFTQTDAAGNIGTQQTAVKGTDGGSTFVIVDFTGPAVPTDIYITHDGDYPNARLDDTVTVTFDTEAGTAVEGTIDGEYAKFTSDDYNGFLELTLDGDETQGSPLAFSFVQSNTHGTTVAQTEVKGFGDGTSVTADFIPPAIPTHIYISHDGTSPNAKLGDIVTVTFDTEEGSAVTGTIDGKSAKFAFNGTSSTLTRTLNGTETQGVSLAFEFTQTDATGHVAAPQNAVKGDGAGTSVTIDPTPPAVPTDISITSDNARDPTLAKKGDVVTVTFDTEKGSAVTGTIDGKSAEDDVTGIAGTLTRTLNGTETEGLLAFSFVQTNDNGSNLAQTAVRGLGINSTVTADFTAPDVPTDISISRDGFLTNLELGETVTVTFDTEEGSTVEGTIDGKYATPDVTGTVGTLKLIIDGTETEGAPLTFEFIQTDAAGNVGTQQTAVKGTGSETSVFIERAVPVIPTNISITHDGDYTNARLDDTVTVTFDTEVGTTVEGTIGGEYATPDVTGTVGTLTRTLDGTVSERSPLTFEFTQFGRTNNVGIEQTAVKGSGDGTSVTADFTAPAVPTHISIFHDASNRAKSGDIVTITFDTEADSAVTGTIGGENATFAFNGTSSTLTRTLDGSETEGLLDFSFVQTDATGNSATTQTEVRGTGRGTYVISDFTAPPVPTSISIISSSTSFAYAKLDDTVTITFDTEEDSTVEGTIGGENATFAFDGSYSTLTRTLNGTEPEGILSFSFVQTDVIGNSAAAQTEVRGDSGETPSVTADFTAPDVSTHISIASDNARDPTKATLDDTVTITFDTEEDSNVLDGMIDGQLSFFALNGTIGTLELFIDGTVTEDEPLTFEFAITDAAGNVAETQNAVKGSGSETSVTADFVAPDVPTNISIAHDGVGTNAKSGDIVTVTFDTEEGSFVTGTIDGEYATPDVTGAVGTLKLTLSGYETQGSPLTFEFTQIDATGNAAETTKCSYRNR